MSKKVVLWALLAAVFIVLASAPGPGTAAEPSKQDGSKLTGKTVNINKASADDLLKSVPLMTKELANSIVKYRKDNGDFATVEELLQVPGMNRDLLKKIKGFFILEGIGGKDCTC